jgi:hypothetical protein
MTFSSEQVKVPTILSETLLVEAGGNTILDTAHALQPSNQHGDQGRLRLCRHT